MKSKCDNYTKTSGCLMTFNGECTKERCFIYRLLQEIEQQKLENECIRKHYLFKNASADFLRDSISKAEENIEHLKDLYNQALKDMMPLIRNLNG